MKYWPGCTTDPEWMKEFMKQVRSMTPGEIEAQRQSWVRGMTASCEHGVVDFEGCPKCRGHQQLKQEG